MSCIICGAPLKHVGAATRIYWKLHTCHGRACVKVFQSLTSDEQEYIHLDCIEDYFLKTKNYIAVLEEKYCRFYFVGGSDYYDDNVFFDEYGFSQEEMFRNYQSYIENTYEMDQYVSNRYWKEDFKKTLAELHNVFYEFPFVYTIYFPPDFNKMAFLYEQYKKLFKLELNVSALTKAARNIERENFALCCFCTYSILRTNHFKQINI